MWFRNPAAAGLSCLLAGLLAGCGSGGSGPQAGDGPVSGSVTMRAYPLIGDNGDKEFWDKQIAAFKKQHPKVEVTVDLQPWADRDKALTAAIAGGTAPDVTYMIPDEIAQFRAQNVLQPLDGLVDTEGYRKNALSAVTFDGKPYGAPILMQVIPGVCDRKVLDEVGVEKPPTTWDELLDMAPAFKEKGKYVTHIIASNEATLNTTFYPWVWQAGGAAFDDAGKPAIDSPAMVEATAFLAKLAAEGYVHRDQAAVNLPVEQSPVGRREVGCLYYSEPILLEETWGDDIVVAPPLKHKAQAAYGTIGSYAMLKSSENKEAAAAWLNFVTSPDVMAALNEAAGYYPPKADVTVEFPEGSIEAQTARYLDLADPGPKVANARRVQGVIAPEVQAAVLGKKSAEQAMRDAAKAAEPVLAGN